MASERRIRVMISSRCKDRVIVRGRESSLSDVRREIKRLITSIAPLGAPLFECWINEDSPPAEGSRDSWEKCLDEVRRADILLVLYNGNPGWSADPGGIGICHAELQAGLSSGAAKVFAIALPLVGVPSKGEDGGKYRRFQEYFAQQGLFVRRVENGDEMLKLIPEVLHEAVTELVALGGREARKGRFDIGDALDWTRLDFGSRKAAMEEVARKALLERPGSSSEGEFLYVRVVGTDVVFMVHAIPSAYTNAAARELVGRPFHRDHELADGLGGRRGGPVHLIACHRGITERQAADLLGQPDVTTVDTAFGILAVDRASKVQCVFLRNCRDQTSTRHAVQRAFDWLARSGESALLAKRSVARARIVKTVAEVL